MVAPRLREEDNQRKPIYVLSLLILCTSGTLATTTETTDSTEDMSTIITTDVGNFTTTALDEETTTPINEVKTPFTIRVQPLEEEERKPISFEKIPAQLSQYIYEVKDGDLQDIGAEESSNLNNVYIHFDSHKYKPAKDVEITSFVADSDTALNMDVEEAVADVRNRSGGADMISAFFVAPEDEVFDNKIDRKRAEDRGDIVRRDRYSPEENSTPMPQEKNSLTDKLLAPLQAAVSLSQEESQKPRIEKQTIKEMPVYKTYIEIQKSIPYELKEEPQKEEPKQPQAHNENSIVPQVMFTYQIPQYRTPLYYRYPLYYFPQSYIGNYIMRHSHENTGVPAYFYRPRPVHSQQYYYLRYPNPTNQLLQQIPQQTPPISNGLQYPIHYTAPSYSSHPVEAVPDAPFPAAPEVSYPPAAPEASYPAVAHESPFPAAYSDSLYQDGSYQDEDQNTLHSEPVPKKVKSSDSPLLNQIPQGHQRSIPFRPSQHVFSSVYPPHTYKVPLMLRGRGLHARSVRSKQLCIEYGGFKPPMVPSVQIDETELPQQAEEKSAIEENS